MKEQFTVEYDMKRVPVQILWNYIASPQGLSQWFADEVTQTGKQFKFIWKGQESTAHLLAMRQPFYIKLRWEDDLLAEKAFFEMKIVQSELTDSTTLVVTDYAASGERDEAIELWNHEIGELQRLMGCI